MLSAFYFLLTNIARKIATESAKRATCDEIKYGLNAQKIDKMEKKMYEQNHEKKKELYLNFKAETS